MSRPRIELQTILEGILGTRNVYFQPPENKKLAYPCIIYNQEDTQADYADNKQYIKLNRYNVTVIDKNPDSVYIDPLLDLKYCDFDRSFVADNLNHYSFTIYF